MVAVDGKTMLVEKLSKMYGLTAGKRGTKDRDLLYTVTVPDTMKAISQAVHGKDPPQIWDRLYYSDFVYAPLSVTPREASFNPSHQVHVDRVIEAIRCPIIVCLPPWRTVKLNLSSEHHQMPGVRERARDIWNEYYRMTYKVGDSTKPFPDHRIVYNYCQEPDGPAGINQVLQEIEDYLEERQERMT